MTKSSRCQLGPKPPIWPHTGSKGSNTNVPVPDTTPKDTLRGIMAVPWQLKAALALQAESTQYQAGRWF